MEKTEGERLKWAFGLATTLSIFIFFGWVFYNGYLDFGNNGSVVAQSNSKKDLATVVEAENAPSPLQSSKETFGAAFHEIGKKYNEFKASMSAVLVPFVTGIEVYERK